jgi:hypothetical protein
MWWHTPVIPALRSLKQKDCEFQASLATQPDFLKKKKKRTENVVQVVQCLPTKHEP